MTWQNEGEDVLGYFTSFPKRSLDSDVKERILQELIVAERAMKRKRKRILWTRTMGISMFAAACFIMYFSGVLHQSNSGISGANSNPLPATTTQMSKNPNSALQTGNQTIAQQQDKQIQTEIQQILNEAKAGKVPNVEFAADTSYIDQVEKQWGKADSTTSAGQGRYATFSKQNVAFGFNKGNQIFDVRSFEPSLTRLTYTDILSTLGAPDDIRYLSNQEQEIVVYNTGSIFELEWVFTALSKQNLNPKLDHISVFCQKDTQNSMSGQK